MVKQLLVLVAAAVALASYEGAPTKTASFMYTAERRRPDLARGAIYAHWLNEGQYGDAADIWPVFFVT